ncbi:hypothetical protein ACWGJX_32245 [Streptomyces sp. NPDC054775]|uniref:hypothetical protein n=1 Tax=Streptomyces sp. NPDC092129 TaxID=3366010 RepID=UPI0037FC1D3F
MSQDERVSGIRAAHKRSQGLRRVGLTTIGVSVAAAAGSLALGTGYAQSVPTAASIPAQRPAATSPTTGDDGAQQPSAPSADPNSDDTRQGTSPHTLRRPAQPPTAVPAQPAPAAPPVTSGNS